MNTEMYRAITAEEVSIYHRDGVVVLPQMFDEEGEV